jgi:hypothetical protein
MPEPFPEIVFDVNMTMDNIMKQIAIITSDSLSIRPAAYDSRATWKFERLSGNGNVEASFDLYLASLGTSSRLYFSAENQRDSEKLADSVAAFIRDVFVGGQVLRSDLKPLSDIPGASEAVAERIATLLQGGKAMTSQEICKALDMLEYTVSINLGALLDKNIIGCTSPDIIPRRYFYK